MNPILLWLFAMVIIIVFSASATFFCLRVPNWFSVIIRGFLVITWLLLLITFPMPWIFLTLGVTSSIITAKYVP